MKFSRNLYSSSSVFFKEDLLTNFQTEKGVSGFIVRNMSIYGTGHKRLSAGDKCVEMCIQSFIVRYMSIYGTGDKRLSAGDKCFEMCIQSSATHTQLGFSKFQAELISS